VANRSIQLIRRPEPEPSGPGLAGAGEDRRRGGARPGVPPREAGDPDGAAGEHGRRGLRRAAAAAAAREPQVRQHPPGRGPGAPAGGLRLLPSGELGAGAAGHVRVPVAGGHHAGGRVGALRRVLPRRRAPRARHGAVPVAVPPHRARRHRRRALGGGRRGGGRRAGPRRPRHRRGRRGRRRQAAPGRRPLRQARAGVPAERGGGRPDDGGHRRRRRVVIAAPGAGGVARHARLIARGCFHGELDRQILAVDHRGWQEWEWEEGMVALGVHWRSEFVKRGAERKEEESRGLLSKYSF
jgi:hypothetical protein